MTKVTLIGILLGSALALTSIKSNAALLVSDDTIDLAGTTAVMQPDLAGPVIYDELIYDSVSPSGNDIFQVGINIQNRVSRSDTDGNLIFAPRIISSLNNTSGNFLVDRAVISGFSDFELDVNYRTDGVGDKGPNSASRSVDGNQLSFDFLSPLVISNLFENPQQDSYFLSIYSNATAFANTGSMSIFGRHLDYPDEVFEFNFAGIAVPINMPVHVPEPALLTLFLTCFAGFVMFKRH
ncbi:hypothetical protein [Paraglaciecola sp. L1A13]|uniref:hypothetical protein n=1 Tax=Paraglaciecola sp. L1A13 TaxID=2686359 RepID=UPI00131C87C4|nr:hypothetical protein [Paraglaciecola sp. L1A13]|tara:strand:- start:997 stop:1710 length:714 start_codon:yes stop_codon:yes gene_type:complete